MSRMHGPIINIFNWPLLQANWTKVHLISRTRIVVFFLRYERVMTRNLLILRPIYLVIGTKYSRKS